MKYKKKEQPETSPKETKSEHEKEIERDLRLIYQHGQDKLPNLTKLEYNRPGFWRRVMLFGFPVLILLAAAAWAGFFLFQPTPSFTGDKISLDIAAPFSAISGETVKYTITIKNQEETRLDAVHLIVRFPNGFRPETYSLQPVQPSEEEPSAFKNIKEWDLGQLSSGKNIYLDIYGALWGEPGTAQVTSATIEYQPADFTSTFEESTVFSTELSDSIITLDTNAPKQSADGDEMEYVFVISNISKDFGAGNVRFDIEYPESFTPTQWTYTMVDLTEDTADPSLQEKDFNSFDSGELQSTWLFETLAPMHGIHFILKGVHKVDETSEVLLPVSVGISEDPQTYIKQRTESITSEIIRGELLTRIIIQGSEDDKPVNFGDTLHYLLAIENKSKSTLSNLQVRAVIDSQILNWNTLVDEASGEVTIPQILWTSKEIKELETLFPGSEITIPFVIKLKEYNQITKKINLNDFKVQSFFETEVGLIDNIETKKKFDSPVLTNQLNSNTTMDAQGRYFTDEQEVIGAGPIPPVVHQKTTYVIQWSIHNSLHELSNITTTAELPEGVTFEGNQTVSAGSLYTNGNKVIWDINRLPDSVPSVTAQFSVSIVPTESDVQKILPLLNETFTQATDNSTNGTIVLAHSGLTTSLQRDPFGKNKGLVQGAE